MDDGNAGPVIYVSYRAFSPRAKDILARSLAALAPGFSLRRTGRESASPRAGGGSFSCTVYSFAARLGATSRVTEALLFPTSGEEKKRGSSGRRGVRKPAVCVAHFSPPPVLCQPRAVGAGFQSSPHGYEELQNPVRAATHYTYIAPVTHRRPFWGNLAP